MMYFITKYILEIYYKTPVLLKFQDKLENLQVETLLNSFMTELPIT